MTPTLIRRTAFVLTAAALPLLAAGPAGAEVPEGWAEQTDVSFLHVLLYVAAFPLGLAVLITLLVYVPALARGERVAPGSQTPQDEWFGGPRTGKGELQSRDAGQTGGGSGSW